MILYLALQPPEAQAGGLQLVHAVKALHIDEDLFLIGKPGLEQLLELQHGQGAELIMTDGNDHAVRLGDLVIGDQVYIVSLLRHLGIRPGVSDDRLDVILSQAVDDVHHLAVAGVGAVFLESEA